MGSSPIAIIAGVVLLIFGALATLFGLLFLAFAGNDEFLAGFAEGAELSGGTSSITTVVVVLAAFLLVMGVLHLASSIGIFAHKEWARWIGLAVTALGLGLGLLMTVGLAGVASDAGTWLIVLVWLGGYGLALVGLIFAGDQFRAKAPRLP